jgi:Tfp pilus assembly PilM family ATPase
MATSKKLGFYWGEEKITVVEFEKNAPLQVVNLPIGSKTNAASPFNSNLTEEIQITAVLQKMLQDNQISDTPFYVSLPMKEIILRSFILPLLKTDVLEDAVKFEAKKYMPFDVEDLSYVFYTVPFVEGQVKRQQVIFFAARKEVLARYERIFKQVNAEVSYCEPYMVSLTKALLYRKDIKPTDHFAFLVIDKNVGRICFIDQGIPQFIREFPIISPLQQEGAQGSVEILNTKIVNEVGNSFDFYARQFNGERIEQMLITSDFVQAGLLDQLESELKVKITKFTPVVNTGMRGQSSDMDAIYALGACVAPPIESLSGFNFLGDHKPKFSLMASLSLALKLYRDILYVFLICLGVLAFFFLFYQMQSGAAQKQYDLLSSQQRTFSNKPVDTITNETQGQMSKLQKYRDIRLHSEISIIILRVASHLPEGAVLNTLDIKYESGDSVKSHVDIEMKGDIFKEDPDEQLAAVNKVFSDLKQDKVLSRFIDKVNLGTLTRELFDNKQVTGFNIHCS